MTDPAVRIKVGLSAGRWGWCKLAPPCAYITRAARGIRQANLGGITDLATATLFGTMAQSLTDAVDLDLAFATGRLRRDAATATLIAKAFGTWLTLEPDHSTLCWVSANIADLGILRIWAGITTTGVRIGAGQAATRVTTEARRAIVRLLTAHLAVTGMRDRNSGATCLAGVAIGLTIFATDRRVDRWANALSVIHTDAVLAHHAIGALKNGDKAGTFSTR